MCIIAVPLSHLSSLVLLILEREICISSRGTGGISFLFCRQVPSFECSSSASWLAFSYFICRLVMYIQNIAKVAVQYHVSLNLETFSIGVFVFDVEGQAGNWRKSECVVWSMDVEFMEYVWSLWFFDCLYKVGECPLFHL